MQGGAKMRKDMNNSKINAWTKRRDSFKTPFGEVFLSETIETRDGRRSKNTWSVRVKPVGHSGRQTLGVDFVTERYARDAFQSVFRHPSENLMQQISALDGAVQQPLVMRDDVSGVSHCRCRLIKTESQEGVLYLIEVTFTARVNRRRKFCIERKDAFEAHKEFDRILRLGQQAFVTHERLEDREEEARQVVFGRVSPHGTLNLSLLMAIASIGKKSGNNFRRNAWLHLLAKHEKELSRAWLCLCNLEREIVYERVYGERSFASIAKEMNLSLAKIRAYSYGAIDKLKQYFLGEMLLVNQSV
jgi:hypothetical protein